MTKDLLVLTRRFPYNNGEVAAESYLETEIRYLAQRFDRVVVVGTEAPQGSDATCDLPDNVISFALGCGSSRAAKARFAAAGAALRFSSDSRVRSAVKADRVARLSRRAFRGYMAARAKDKLDALERVLERAGIVPAAVYSFWMNDNALAAAWLKERFGCVAVSRAHNYDLYVDRSPVGWQPFRSYLLNRLDAVLPCSADGRAYLVDKYGADGSRCPVSYLGTRELPDKSHEAPGDTVRVVSCSRVAHVKRVGLLAEAFSILDREGIDVSWTHFGDGDLMDDVRQTCEGFTSITCDFRGLMPNEAVLEAYEREHFDVFINVSSSEGLPIAIMEACGCGIPVIATNVGGTRELVVDGVNGRLLDAGCSCRDIAVAIKRFIDLDTEERLAMRVESRRLWEQGFRTRDNVVKFVALLDAPAAAESRTA